MNYKNKQSCIWDDFTDEYSSVSKFENTPVISRVHNVSPRWGHTSNINVLFSEDDDEKKKNYVMGILGTAIAIVLFVLFWLLVLFIMKRLGTKRVGILSGTTPSYQKQVITSEAGETDEIVIRIDKKSNYALLIMARISVLLCGIGITIAVIFLIYDGVNNLRNAANNTQKTIAILRTLTNQAITIIRDYIIQQTNVIKIIKEFLNVINTELCPARNVTLCNNIDNLTTCNFDITNDILLLPMNNTTIDYTIRDIISSQVSIILNNAEKFENDLIEFEDTLRTAYTKADDFNWAFAVAVTFAILYVIFVWIICYGVIAVWFQFNNRNNFQRTLRCFRHWIIVPIFILCLLISLIFTIVFIMGSYISSDLCYDGPHVKIELLLQKHSNTIDPTLLELARYYIHGCEFNTFPPIFEQHIESISNIIEQVTQFVLNFKNETTTIQISDIMNDNNSVNNNTSLRYLQDENNDTFNNVCGTDITSLSDLGESVIDTLCGIGTLLYNIFQFFSCKNWRPLYQTLVHDVICYNANDGLYYTAITQFAVVIMALIMLSLRAVFFDIPEEEATSGAAVAANETVPGKEQAKQAPPSSFVEDYGLPPEQTPSVETC